MGIVNAKLMANYALAFNIGADLLNKGNRAVEKHLGSEKKSGDTVYVPIMDSGQIFNKLDLTGEDLTVVRDEVPVTVRPIVTAASVTQEDLTLSIDNPEIMAKRVAKLANDANLRAYRTLRDGAQAYVATDNGVEAIKRAAFDAEAYTVGSKIGGETYGVTHPMTWNRIVATLSANFAPNPSIGQKLYTNELGNFMGFNWSKGSEMAVIAQKDPALGNVTLQDGTDFFDFSGAGPANPVNGEITDPFTVAGVWAADALGLPIIGTLKTFRARYHAASGQWKLTAPVFFTGARINAAGNLTNGTITGAGQSQLVAGKSYFSPAIIWKEADFLVAVKGIEKFLGSDSFTVPTEYSDKNILPLRGTAWTDPGKASTLFRVDCLLGFALYQQVSISSIYIPTT